MGQTAVHPATKSWPKHLQTTQFLGHLLTCQTPLTLAVWLRRMWRERPVPTSNTCRALSLPAATRWEDTQEKATSLMVSMLPCRQAVSAPVEASHRRTFLSVPPLASLLPVLQGTQVGRSPVCWCTVGCRDKCVHAVPVLGGICEGSEAVGAWVCGWICVGA